MTATELTELTEESNHDVINKDVYEFRLLKMCDAIIDKYKSQEFSKYERWFFALLYNDAEYFKNNLKDFENLLRAEGMEYAIQRMHDPKLK